MLFRLIALWLCLMTTSLHTTGARAVAMTNGIEEKTNVIDADSREEYRLSDKVGTPTEAYNAGGEEVWSRRLDMNWDILEENYDRYAPYSEQIRIPFLFQGQYYDHETELAYNRFRYYSPELGRYISEDPIRLEGGIALLRYVENSNTWIDAWGLTGAYIFTDGKISYIGKGPVSRMKASMSARIKGVRNAIASSHMDFGNDDIGFMVEYKLMEHYNARNSSDFANSSRLDSPGKKKYNNANVETRKKVDRFVEKIIKDFEQKKRK